MPGNHGLRLDQDERRTPVAPEGGKPSPQKAIRRGELRTFHRTLENAELMPESDHLNF